MTIETSLRSVATTVGMDALTPSQLTLLHQELSTLHATLLASLGRGQAGTAPVDLDEPIGRLSRMDAIQQQQMAKASRARHQARLVRTESALARVAQGTYGDCLVCDDPIGYGRLRAQPEAPLCVACQSEREVR